MRLPSDSDETDKIVQLFADKIPHTHGAPVRATVGNDKTLPKFSSYADLWEKGVSRADHVRAKAF